MYEEHFRLKSNPFRSAAKGSNVFVGPQQATVMTRLKKALAGSDNVVTVSGPVGVGKTTVVTRALETNDKHQLVAWIGRMRLAPDEMLDLLLSGFGVNQKITGTVRRFALFKKLLAERIADKKRVIVVIEDALRIGTDALLELEALTANDAGSVNGANIILMGPPEFEQQLKIPELARLRQRTRIGQSVTPFNEIELQGYLKHCMRIAGANFEDLFNNDAATMLFRCSEGIPRIINNLCDAALTAAAEADCHQITAQLIESVAADVYGLEPAATQDAADTDVVSAVQTITFDNLPTLSHSMRVEVLPTLQPSELSSKNADEHEPQPEAAKSTSVPDLDALEVAITKARHVEQSPEAAVTELPEPEIQESIPQLEPKVELVPEMEVGLKAEPAIELIPELEVDLEAEAVIDPETKSEIDSEPSPEPAAKEPVVPDITLDRRIGEQRKSGNDFNAVAAELASANSLEEISDVMAETIFGEEFQQIAAEALTNPPDSYEATGDTGVFVAPAITSPETKDLSANDANEVKQEAVPKMPESEPPSVSDEPESIEDQFQTSITQTLKIVDPDNLPNDNSEDGKASGIFGRLRNSFRG